ncbi:condensation domain-containing protein [Streptomyces avicenniae]|uniref:condensation domain-containing protein n=1 Tax=Streptomyces avicenniae TaxID=500153 RepID=UPI0006993F4D|nr:condensation domain-containing protein [Streptomyces avicenniae]
MARLNGQYAHWHNLVYSAAWLTGGLDLAALRTAWRVLSLRHDVMRRAYLSPDEACTYEEPLTEVDFHTADTDAEALETMRVALVGSAFRLDAVGLSRIVVVQRDERRHLFGIALDHNITDLTSWNLLVAELGELYGRALAGESIAAEFGRADSYQEFASLLRREFAGSWGEKCRAFWLSYAERWEASSPAFSVVGTTEGEPSLRTVRHALPKDAHHRVGELARRARATPFVVVTSAVLAGLQEVTSASTVEVGVAHHGRVLPHTARTLGQFVQAVPMRLDGRPGGPLETVRHVFAQSLDAFEYAPPFSVLGQYGDQDPTSVSDGSGVLMSLDQTGEGFHGSPLAGTRAESVALEAPAGHGLVEPLVLAWYLDGAAPELAVRYDENAIPTAAVESLIDAAAGFALSDAR